MTTGFTTNTQSNAAGVVNIAQGIAVTDAGGATATTFTCGFVPRRIRWYNVTDLIVHEWFEGMTNPGAIKEALTGDKTLETTNGITVGTAAAGTAGTFTVAAAIIVASKTHVWEAVG
jgi:hypothetical protein